MDNHRTYYQMVQLEVPFTPNMMLSGNARRRIHPWAQQRLTKEEKLRWYMALLEALNGQRPTTMRRVRMTIDLTFPRARRRDYENLWSALKPCLDVMASPDRKTDQTLRLGLIADDSTYCIKEAILRVRVHRGQARTAITLEEVQDDNNKGTEE